MEKLDVLVVTMNQNDLSLVTKMNIESNAVIANQVGHCAYVEEEMSFGKIKMVSTDTKGVGVNRNLALLYSESDYLLMADDDEVLYHNYEENIIRAFEEVPEADILIFNINTISDKPTSRRVNTTIKKLSMLNIFNYGAVRIAIKKNSLIRSNIVFTHLFGGGAKYSAGEDSMFLKKCLSEGMQIYTYPLIIADVYQFESTWFKGYDEKYFFDKGCWAAATFHRCKVLMCILFTIKTYEKCDIPLSQALKLSLAGCRNFKKALDYDAWKKASSDL